MTHRRRVLAVLALRPADRRPWMARLGIWYDAHQRRGTLPREFAGMSRAEVEQGAGPGPGLLRFLAAGATGAWGDLRSESVGKTTAAGRRHRRRTG
jgi:hypothetical protein